MVSGLGREMLFIILEGQVNFISFYFLYSTRSQQKSFKATFPVEQVLTLFFY